MGYSQGSLEEVRGDIRELTEDKFLKSKPGSSLGELAINLKDFNSALKPKGDLKDFKGDYIPLTTLYLPLKSVRAQDLSYEIFMELINKTDYLLRTLVASLEKKLANDKKGYQVERARIRSKFS